MLIRRSIAFVVFALAMSAASASAGTILSISPSATTVSVGDTFSVDVNIAGAIDLYAFQFDFMFSDALLDPVFVPPDSTDPVGGYSTEGLFLSQGGAATFFSKGSYSDPGTIAFTYGLLVDAVPGVDGAGTLATLMFTATGAGLANFLLVGDIILLDSLLSPITPDDIGQASITINSVSSVDDTSTVGQLLTILLSATGLGAIARRQFGRTSGT